MVVEVNGSLLRLVHEKYSSIEYILRETIPAISLANLKNISLGNANGNLDMVGIEISDDIVELLEGCVSEKRTIGEVVNDVITIGYILEG